LLTKCGNVCIIPKVWLFQYDYAYMEIPMIIDFSKILTREGREENFELPIEMESYKTSRFCYSFDSKEPVKLTLRCVKSKVLGVDAEIDVTLNIPCDRCLEDVKKRIFIKTSKEFDLTKSSIDECSDEDFEDFSRFIEGTNFDLDEFVHGEILFNLPMKVLCKEDCKGFCNRCGTNLNHNMCGCDTTELDPRMAKILEVFNSSIKEV